MANSLTTRPSPSRRPSRGPPLQHLVPAQPPPPPPPPLSSSSDPAGVAEAEEHLRALIAEQTPLSPLEDLVRRSIVEGRQTPGRGSESGIVSGLEQLLRETGDLPYRQQEQQQDQQQRYKLPAAPSLDDVQDAPADPSPLHVRPATVVPDPTRPLPSVPPPTTPTAPAHSALPALPSPQIAQHLQPLPALQPPSSSTSDDKPALPHSPEPQTPFAEPEVNDLYSRPTGRRTRLSTLGPKIRRDGPAPWEEEEAFEHDGASIGAGGAAADVKALRSSRSSPDFKEDLDGAGGEDGAKGGKRAWISSLGRKKKDREDDAGAAWKALGYAPPSPSASLYPRRPPEPTFPSLSHHTRASTEPASLSGIPPVVDRNLKTRRSASGGLRKIFAKSPGGGGSQGEIHEISAPLPTLPPPNAVPIPQVLSGGGDDYVYVDRRSSSISTSSSPPPPPSPIARRRPPRLRSSPQLPPSFASMSQLASSAQQQQDFGLELRPVSMAFSAKFSDHLASPTSPQYAFADGALSPRSAHGFGGMLVSSPSTNVFPDSGSSGEHHTPQRRPLPPLSPRRPLENPGEDDIAEESEDDSKDELIRALRHELAEERALRKRVVDDYETRLRDLKNLLIANGMAPVPSAQLPPTPRTPGVHISPPGTPADA